MNGHYLWLDKSHPSTRPGRQIERSTVISPNGKSNISTYYEELKKLSTVVQAANMVVKGAMVVDTGILINPDVFRCLKDAVRSLSGAEQPKNV